MKLTQFITCMERIAPASLAWERDNVGLLVGTRRQEVQKVLVALDCTSAVAREAAEWGADLVLTHHPLFFNPVSSITPTDPQTAAAYTLIENGIGLFAAHTNLDAADGGVNDVLCHRLGLQNIKKTDRDPILRLASLEPGMTIGAFSGRCEQVLSAKAVTYGDPRALLHSVAVMGGAGGEAVALAHELGADVLVTGEAKHHEALAASELGLGLVVLGHYQTEAVVLEPLISRLQQDDSDVQYKKSRTGRALFVRSEGGCHE